HPFPTRRSSDLFVLGFWRRHARNLTHGTPRKRAFAEGRAELGQALERKRRAQLVLGSSEAIAEQPFDVLRERGIPEVSVHLGARGTQQRQPLAAVEVGAFLREPLELLVCQDPIHVSIDPNPRFHEASIHPCFASSLVSHRRAFTARIDARALSMPNTRERATQRPTKHLFERTRARQTRALEKPSRKTCSPRDFLALRRNTQSAPSHRP